MAQHLKSRSETLVNRSSVENKREPSKKQTKNEPLKPVRRSKSSEAVDRSDSARTSMRSVESTDYLNELINHAWDVLLWFMEFYGVVVLLSDLACFFDVDPRDPGLQL